MKIKSFMNLKKIFVQKIMRNIYDNFLSGFIYRDYVRIFYKKHIFVTMNLKSLTMSHFPEGFLTFLIMTSKV